MGKDNLYSLLLMFEVYLNIHICSFLMFKVSSHVVVCSFLKLLFDPSLCNLLPIYLFM